MPTIKNALQNVLWEVDFGVLCARTDPMPDPMPVVDSFNLSWEGPGVQWSVEVWLTDGRQFRTRGSTPRLALKRLVSAVRKNQVFERPFRPFSGPIPDAIV